MTQKVLEKWMRRMTDIWLTKKPNDVSKLCASKFVWYESPFSKPITSKDKLAEEWQHVLDQKEISVQWKILSTGKDLGIVQWFANFTEISSNKKFEYDGIYVVKLNNNDKCTEFRQWYNKK